MNEYYWGGFKGDPNRLVDRYYDAHLYVANRGTHRVIFRLPCDLLDPDVVEDYRVDNQLSAWVTDEFIVLDFTSEDHAGEFNYDYDYDAAVTLLTDLQALAERADSNDTFTLRVIALRQTHARKPTLIERLNQARI